MADAMEVVEFPAGKLVFRQGDVGDRFYLVKSGTAVVSKGQGADRQILTRLTEGGYFGERALIKSETRCWCPTSLSCSCLRCVSVLLDQMF